MKAIRKTVSLKTFIVAILVSTILVGTFSYNVGRAGYVGDETEQWYTPSQEASYIVGQYNSTHYYMQNHTGHGYSGYEGYDFLSSNASAVSANAFGNLTNGGAIHYKTGVYPINNIPWGNDTTITGEGYNNTIFQLSGNNNMFVNKGTTIDYRILLQDVRLEGNSASYSGSGIVGDFSDLTLSRVWITDFSGWGVILKGHSGAVAQHFHMDYSHIRSCVTGGLYLGSYAADHVISNSYFVSNGGSQVTINVTNNIQFIGDHFAGAGQPYGDPAFGILYNGTDASLGLRVIGCEFENIDSNAICLVASGGGDINRVEIANNNFNAIGQETLNTYAVINCSNVHYLTIDGNEFRDIVSTENGGNVPWYAIYSTISYVSMISGNTVRDGYGGIYVSNSTSVSVVGNSVSNCTYRGIYLYASDNSSVTGNTVRLCDDDGVRLYLTNSTSVVGNTVVGNGMTGTVDGIGIGFHSSNNTITGNVVSGNFGYQINIESATCLNNLITANSIDSSGATGSIQNLGTSSNIHHNKGFVTENSGSSTVTIGSTTVTVTHGCAGTVDYVQITPMSDLGGRTWWVSSKGATTFVINISSADLDNNLSFDWEVEYQP